MNNLYYLLTPSSAEELKNDLAQDGRVSGIEERPEIQGVVCCIKDPNDVEAICQDYAIHAVSVYAAYELMTDGGR